ncbi:kinetochore Sim4 complex subunit FTA2-domain-containing protein [Xylaria arbuscula]|nr:kinetochore Sim4 complex subunit FTA2-domain-containing protein [Xylaria arbuscula]
MGDMIPDIKGPKLSPFSGNLDNIDFIKSIGPHESEKASSGDIPHARVFLVRIDGVRYVMKVFNFFRLHEIRPFIPFVDHLLTDDLVRFHMDPFYAECRAFGLLVEKKKDDLLAVRCHGYTFLPLEIEQLIEKRFGDQFIIENWNRGPEDEGCGLRAIIKDYIPSKSTYGRRKLSVIKSKIKQLNKLGVFNMDIRKENIRGGRLFDFSIAITSPHICLSTQLRPIDHVVDDMRFDCEMFEKLEERELERRETIRKAARTKLRRN